jgi:hypothetical protein
MDMQQISEVFTEQLEELNIKDGIADNNNWLSPAFIDVYQTKLEEKIRSLKNWSAFFNVIQVVVIILLFNSRVLTYLSLSGFSRTTAISVILVLMLVASTLIARMQKRLASFEKQLVLLETYAKLLDRSMQKHP